MDHLDEITVEDLRHALDEVEGKKATQRLTAAIAYKNGVTQTELASWFGVERRTIYNWLTRLADEPLPDAVSDARRTGRPRKLDNDQHERLKETLRAPPTEAGYDAAAWSPTLVRRYLVEAFDAEYSRPSCRRLMKEAGLRYREPRRKFETDGRDGAVEERRRPRGGWVPE